MLPVVWPRMLFADAAAYRACPQRTCRLNDDHLVGATTQST